MSTINPFTLMYQPVMFQPPAPPQFETPPTLLDQAPKPKDETKTPPSTNSIGQSPVVQAFLLRLQELGLTSIPGTDDADRLAGWSDSLVDSGDGDDRIDVWSNSVVDAGAGNDSVRAWSGSAVYGGAGNDQLDVWSDSAVDGGTGDDVIRAWSNTVVSGGDGNDMINAWSDSLVDGGAGNDTITAWTNSKIYGGAGDDRITATADSYAEGGEGNDIISADNGAVVSGGKGDDVISAMRGSTVMFNAGDGKDTIYAGFAGTTIQLGEGLTAADLKMEMSGNTATLSFGGSDQISLQMGPGSPVTLRFADGSTQEIPAPKFTPGSVRLQV